MRKGFHEELEDLKKSLLKMGSLVEETIYDSIRAIKEQDFELADQVIKADDKIDEFELKLKEKSAKLIALQQPVARDLRTILVVSEIVTDLERMGDYSCNIAYMLKERIKDQDLIKPLVDIPRMTDLAVDRLNKSLDAFVEQDAILAKEVAESDEKIDELDEQIFRELITFMISDPESIEQASALIFISRFLERIGDHSTNICEGVIYMISGKRQVY